MAPGRPRQATVVLLFGVLAFALSQTAVIPAIGSIAHDRQVTIDQATWVLTAYLISAAILTPILGRLSDLFGSRRLLIVTLGLFTAGAATAAASSSIAGLVVGRGLQGVGGAILPICYSIVRGTIAEARRPVTIALLTGTMSAGGGIGLVLGGLIVDAGSYRWIFLLAVVMGAVTLAMVRVVVPALPAPRGGRAGAAPTLVTRTALATSVIALLSGYGLFTIFVVVPQLVTLPRGTGFGFGQPALAGALILLPGTIAMLAVAPITGRLAQRFAPKVPVVAGCAIAATGQLGLAARHDGLAEVAVWTVVGFVGLGQVLAALPNVILDSVPPHRVGEATAVNGFMRLVGGAVGSQAAAVLLAAATSSASAWPGEAGFVRALLAGSAVCLVAAIVAGLIPRERSG